MLSYNLTSKAFWNNKIKSHLFLTKYVENAFVLFLYRGPDWKTSLWLYLLYPRKNKVCLAVTAWSWRCRVLTFWLDEKCLRAIWLVEKIFSMPCCDRAMCRDFSHSYEICSTRHPSFLTYFNLTFVGSCDFEQKSLCTWINVANANRSVGLDDFDWTLGSGGTGSYQTGPSTDHTTGTAAGMSQDYSL
jgi:hypothetical protein